jgi:hypothetical protein
MVTAKAYQHLGLKRPKGKAEDLFEEME